MAAKNGEKKKTAAAAGRCKKCGSRPDIWETEAPDGQVVYDVYCGACGMGSSYAYPSKAAAVEAWNKGICGTVRIDRKYAHKV